MKASLKLELETEIKKKKHILIKYLMLSSSDTAKSLEAQLIRLNLFRQWRMKVSGGRVAAQNWIS